MVHDIEHKRFWCGHVFLKKDKEEFLTDFNRYLQQNSDPEISSTISTKFITFKHYKSAHQ